MKAGVALGSNVGDRLLNLRAARKAIIQLKGAAPPILSSSIYETEPIDCEPAAGQFLNAVLEFEYDGAPLDLLRNLKQIETDLGRPRAHERNVSRNIDVDLLYFGDVKINHEELNVPHARMHLRRFVLQPLADIHPDLVLPNQTKTVRELLASLAESGNVRRLNTDWESA
jgi:2-amino-4-hydroxy-6-hydroxymethyldihydropteridine diphosphokinase